MSGGDMGGEMKDTARLFHVIESQQFGRPLLDQVMAHTRTVAADPAAFGGALASRVMATLFYEPSTRTRLSFEAAMLRLGGRVISTENAREFSSGAKGETLEDTIRVVSGYADVIVLRHNEMAASARSAAVSSVPVINAGDGPGQHPTQALLDLFTIEAEIGHIDGLRIAMVGDLANGRTVRSLSFLLSRYRDVQIHFVAPHLVAMKDDIKAHLEEHRVSFSETEDLNSVLPHVDVVYQTRIQKERFANPDDYDRVRSVYVIGERELGLMGDRAVLMHPLPRVDEIDPAVDGDRRAAYFRQARNGLYVRMALLHMILAE